MDPKAHWEDIYQKKSHTDVSWYQSHPGPSLAMIQASGTPLSAPILDMGGGASTLVDHLLAEGFTDLTVMDLSEAALTAARRRLREMGDQVEWIAGDAIVFRPRRRYTLWHDRAVFHFLDDEETRARYIERLKDGLAPGGHLVLATSGPEGPTRCSGLPVRRYATEELIDILGPKFLLVDASLIEHTTPGGQPQQFQFGLWRFEERG
jgi:trans-aconitate methyltransferase